MILARVAPAIYMHTCIQALFSISVVVQIKVSAVTIESEEVVYLCTCSSTAPSLVLLFNSPQQRSSK